MNKKKYEQLILTQKNSKISIMWNLKERILSCLSASFDLFKPRIFYFLFFVKTSNLFYKSAAKKVLFGDHKIIIKLRVKPKQIISLFKASVSTFKIACFTFQFIVKTCSKKIWIFRIKFYIYFPILNFHIF